MDLSDAKKILEKGRKILLKTGPWRLILICLCGILIVALSSGTGEKKTVLQEDGGSRKMPGCGVSIGR